MNFGHAALVQATACAGLGSPFMARLCSLFAQRLRPTFRVADRVLNWPGDCSNQGDAVPLRLAAALHALVLQAKCPALCAAYPPNTADDQTLWSAVETAFSQHSSFILDWLESPPQTNEVRRAAGLIPAFSTLAQEFGLPLITSELGGSAGLNSNWPAYGLQLPGGRLGPETPELMLSPDWSGPLPPLCRPGVKDRAACDLNPLSPASGPDRLRLMAYAWPDQPERLKRMHVALDMAAISGITVEKADAALWLKRRLAPTVQGAIHVVFHTIVWQYFPHKTAKTCLKLLQTAANRATPSAPLAWLRVETDGKPDGAPILLTIWPGNQTRSLGRMDFHGRWVQWAG